MRIKETLHEKTIRHLKRDSLHEVRETYFNTTWTSYRELMDYFKESGWTRTELVKADRPRGRGDERYEKRILYWYLSGKVDYYEPIPADEIKVFEKKIQNDLPTIVTTWHGPYESEIIYNPTFKRLLRCVKESIYVNKDPDHCGIASLPEITIHNDGGPNKDIQYQVITFCMDS
jgi:hypothetical protein